MNIGITISVGGQVSAPVVDSASLLLAEDGTALLDESGEGLELES